MENLKHLLSGNSLSADQSRALAMKILSGELSAAQIGGALVALKSKGETIDEISGFAAGMRDSAIPLEIKKSTLIDIVGTGGVTPDAFNISTTASFVVAAGGVAVAKHGNRAASSQTGSFDTLEALGIKIDISPERVAESVEHNDLGFVFARTFHTGMKHVGPVRSELGVRTIFNYLGPLTNPAKPTHMVLGVSAPEMLEPFAEILQNLGVERALVVHGDGMDDLCLTLNQIVEIDGNIIKRFNLTPEEVGLKTAQYETLKGGDAALNAEILISILSGKEQGPKRDVVTLCAGAAFYVSGKNTTISEGVALAAQVIDSGKAIERLERLRKFTNE